ncbi:2-isopropylmalate synthase [Acidothermaceae bacterium B102]|nr:2-isopropylmalate synthase [Acidothermaceae bacterium B102]
MSFLRTPAGPVPPHAPHWNPQRGSQMPFHRYRPAHDRVDVPVTGRAWPDKTLEHAPLWVPVDLRDGNQALAQPMDPARKRQMFDLFLAMGFKEIEVGYPSASQIDYDFVRMLAEDDVVPDDVTIVVFTAARTDLIERTYDSIAGLRNVVVHMYTATAPTWRDVVLGKSRADLLALITAAGSDVLRGADRYPSAHIRFEFSPEVFNLTEPEYVLEVCNAMTALWDATPERPVIHNLPATVEFATPNVYADQIEHMHRSLERRSSVILSVHPHNDRGTGVAAAELAVLAGAQRVEGCLFGNGERTGNVDLVTLALNVFSQGIDPMVDFSDIDAIRRTVEHCNQLDVPERHPYAGSLVYTAFSGTHQDAIKKGFAHQEATGAVMWDVPYLPIDPHDVGRSYEAVIRVNSQSGKGGVAYLLEGERGLTLPRGLQVELSRVVQGASESSGGEITAEAIGKLFDAEFVDRTSPVTLVDWEVFEGSAQPHRVTAVLSVDGVEQKVAGEGTGPLDAFARALSEAGFDVEILDYSEHALTSGRDSRAAAYVEVTHAGRTRWGVGISHSVLTASVQAIVAALNR